MPAFVKTKKDEHLWAKAKSIAEEAGHKEDWAYVTGIFKKMKGGKVGKKAARPIYVPKPRIHNITRALLRELGKKIPNTNKPIGEKNWAQVEIQFTRADGEEMFGAVLLRSRARKGRTYVLGGAFGHERRTGTPVVIVELNGSLTGEAYQKALTYPKVIEDLIYGAILHEVTHGADPSPDPTFLERGKGQQEVPSESEVDWERYHNNTREVRAHLQEIVSELEKTWFSKWEKLQQTFGGKAFDRLLGMSATWKEIQEHLNPKNRRYIQKAVWTALQDWQGAIQRVATVYQKKRNGPS